MPAALVCELTAEQCWVLVLWELRGFWEVGRSGVSLSGMRRRITGGSGFSPLFKSHLTLREHSGEPWGAERIPWVFSKPPRVSQCQGEPLPPPFPSSPVSPAPCGSLPSHFKDVRAPTGCPCQCPVLALRVACPAPVHGGEPAELTSKPELRK